MDECKPLLVRNNDDLSEAEQCSMPLTKQSRGSREKRPHGDLGASMTENRFKWLFSAYQRGQSLEHLVAERYTKWRASRVIVTSGMLILIIRCDNKGRKLWRRGNVYA